LPPKDRSVLLVQQHDAVPLIQLGDPSAIGATDGLQPLGAALAQTLLTAFGPGVALLLANDTVRIHIFIVSKNGSIIYIISHFFGNFGRNCVTNVING
jgi:hypothetical protein